MQQILIDKDNLSLFEGMMSPAIARRIVTGEEIAIGAIANPEEGGNVPAGVLSFYVDETVVRVTWVYIVPAWRQTSFASELLRSVIEGFLYDDERTVTSMLAVYPQSADLDTLFTACGFTLEEEGGTLAHTTLADCFAIPLTKGRTSKCVVALSQLNPAQVFTLLHNNPAMQGVLEPNPALWVERYLPCSGAYVAQGRIMGLLLLSMQEGNLYLDYAYSEKPEIMALPYLIESARRELAVSYPPETPLYLATANATAAAIATKLLGEMNTTGVRIAQLDFDELLDEMAQYGDGQISDEEAMTDG